MTIRRVKVIYIWKVGYVAEGEETGTPFNEVSLTEGVGKNLIA